MSVAKTVNQAVYASVLAEAATYIDQGLVSHSLRVLRVHDPESLVGLTEVGVRDAQLAFRLQKSDLPARPQDGEEIRVGTTVWRVDGAPQDLNETEWLVYVIDGDADG